MTNHTTKSLKLFQKKSEKSWIWRSKITENTIKEVLQNNDLDIFGKHTVINSFIKKHNLNKKDVLYIGDELRDIEACKKSKIKIISVTWGFDSCDLLLSGNPDFVAKTPTDIIEIASGYFSIPKF